MTTLPSTLDFEKTTLSIIDHNGRPWLTSKSLAKALAYKDASSVTRIFNRNSEEFTENMTGAVKLTAPDGTKQDTRIFSPRGCHLVAMFARTDRAKSFRRWTLDVLDNLNKPEPRETYETITRKQYNELSDTIHRAFCGWLWTESEKQAVYNAIRVTCNIHRVETMPADRYDEILKTVKHIEKMNDEFMDSLIKIRAQYSKEVISGNAPWTPSLKGKWKKLFEQAMPERPDWLAIEKQVSKKLEEVK